MSWVIDLAYVPGPDSWKDDQTFINTIGHDRYDSGTWLAGEPVRDMQFYFDERPAEQLMADITAAAAKNHIKLLRLSLVEDDDDDAENREV